MGQDFEGNVSGFRGECGRSWGSAVAVTGRAGRWHKEEGRADADATHRTRRNDTRTLASGKAMQRLHDDGAGRQEWWPHRGEHRSPPPPMERHGSAAHAADAVADWQALLDDLPSSKALVLIHTAAGCSWTATAGHPTAAATMVASPELRRRQVRTADP